MRIKKYEVFDMKEAMKLIKEELGPDAMILSSRKVVKNNSFGLFSRPIIEVTAAIEEDDRIKGKKTVGVNVNTPKSPSNTTEQPKDLDRIVELINTLGLNKFDGLINDITEIKKQMIEMKSSMKENIMVDLTGSIREFYNLMVKNGVDEVIAYKFLKKIEKRASHGLTPPNQIKKTSSLSLCLSLYL